MREGNAVSVKVVLDIGERGRPRDDLHRADSIS
jgi:hypothetical protein